VLLHPGTGLIAFVGSFLGLQYAHPLEPSRTFSNLPEHYRSFSDLPEHSRRFQKLVVEWTCSSTPARASSPLSARSSACSMPPLHLSYLFGTFSNLLEPSRSLFWSDLRIPSCQYRISHAGMRGGACSSTETALWSTQVALPPSHLNVDTRQFRSKMCPLPRATLDVVLWCGVPCVQSSNTGCGVSLPGDFFFLCITLKPRVE